MSGEQVHVAGSLDSECPDERGVFLCSFRLKN